MANPSINEALKNRRFNHLSNIVPDKIYFTIQENTIGTAGNFVAFTGLPKAGKSTFISAIIASAITGREVFDFHIHAFKEKYRVAIFDTEQSPFDFNRTVNNIEKLTGYDRAGIFKYFDAFLLREDSSSEILKMINEYLKTTPDCSVIIIDGLLDCIDSFNDEVASKKLIRILKKWGKLHDILIIVVIHLGKKDNSSIGHLGSSSDRYAQSTLLIEKTKTGTFVCAPKFLRSAKDFDNIEIMYSTTDKKYIKV